MLSIFLQGFRIDEDSILFSLRVKAETEPFPCTPFLYSSVHFHQRREIHASVDNLEDGSMLSICLQGARIDEDSTLFSLRVKAETEPFSLYSKRYQYNISPLTGAFIATNDEINVDLIKKTIKI